MKNKIFTFLRETKNCNFNYFNVNLKDAKFKLNCSYLFNPYFNIKKAEEKEKIKQNIKRLCQRNRKSFMEFSKNYFCEKKKENLKSEEKKQKKENYIKKTMRELKECGMKGLWIYYFLYLFGVAVIYFFIENGFINSKSFY